MAGAACYFPGQLLMVGFLDVRFSSCCDVTFPEARLPCPFPRKPGWASTLSKNVLECICSPKMVDSFQFCNLSRGDEPKFHISPLLRNVMTAMRLAHTAYKSFPWVARVGCPIAQVWLVQGA